MNFTDSPYEKMMKQIPRLGPREKRVPPPGSPCRDCPYIQDGPCVGICYRDLMLSRKGGRATSGQLVPKPRAE
jgi:hypothetical protein